MQTTPGICTHDVIIGATEVRIFIFIFNSSLGLEVVLAPNFAELLFASHAPREHEEDLVSLLSEALGRRDRRRVPLAEFPEASDRGGGNMRCHRLLSTVVSS